ncbi:MAG TPA: phage holin family protein, partial [Ilumatobacteraceae bacterium]|nr:phage holin family protein [Ilumatobacteraceae bacterium]
MTTPTLPSRTPGRIPLRRHLIELVITSVSFWFIAWILPGISIRDFGTALVSALLISALNAVLWPIISRYFARIILWTAGLLGIVANGLILYVAADILDGLVVDSVWQAVLASVLMTVIGIVVSTWLSVDDDAVWQRQTVRRMVNRLEPPTPTDVPGILFLQIDGLAEPVVRQ